MSSQKETAFSTRLVSYDFSMTISLERLEPVVTSQNGDGDKKWENDLTCDPMLDCSDSHPGATGCLRGMTYDGPHVQQCCYRGIGSGLEYIQVGTCGAGLPDYSGYGTGLWERMKADAEPFDWCCTECEVDAVFELYMGQMRTFHV